MPPDRVAALAGCVYALSYIWYFRVGLGNGVVSESEAPTLRADAPALTWLHDAKVRFEDAAKVGPARAWSCPLGQLGSGTSSD
jgi:hypothetical protein